MQLSAIVRAMCEPLLPLARWLPAVLICLFSVVFYSQTVSTVFNGAAEAMSAFICLGSAPLCSAAAHFGPIEMEWNAGFCCCDACAKTVFCLSRECLSALHVCTLPSSLSSIQTGFSSFLSGSHSQSLLFSLLD
jgi:hypothetical protein